MKADRVRGLVVGALIAAATVLAVAGCGGGESTGGAAGGGSTETPSALNVGFSAPMQTLDPDLALDYANSALHLIGGNLFELKGKSAVPGLATGAKVSKDQLSWTITLKRGLKFSDGSSLTSTDVKATLERSLKDKGNVNPALFERIDSVDAPSPDTVVIHLNAPYPSLKEVLGYPQFAIFPAKQLGQKNFFDAPISAGPYKLASWGGGNTAVFELDKYYAGSKPKTAKITFSTVPDANARLAQVQSGQLDFAYSLPPNLLGQISAPAVKQVTELFGLETMSMRATSAPLDELPLRKAISAAINREELSEIVWLGSVKPLAGLWPPTMEGYDPELSTAQDLPLAEKELKGTKCESGCTLTLTYSPSAYPEQEQEAPVIKKSLEEIGITVKLNSIDATSYYGALGGGEFQLMLIPTFDFADVPDGITTYGLMPAQETNFSGLTIPGLVPTVQKTVQSTGGAREEGLQELNDLLLKYVPWAPLTGNAIIAASRFEPDVIQVLPSTLIGVEREDGSVY